MGGGGAERSWKQQRNVIEASKHLTLTIVFLIFNDNVNNGDGGTTIECLSIDTRGNFSTSSCSPTSRKVQRFKVAGTNTNASPAPNFSTHKQPEEKCLRTESATLIFHISPIKSSHSKGFLRATIWRSALDDYQIFMISAPPPDFERSIRLRIHLIPKANLKPRACNFSLPSVNSDFPVSSRCVDFQAESTNQMTLNIHTAQHPERNQRVIWIWNRLSSVACEAKRERRVVGWCLSLVRHASTLFVYIRASVFGWDDEKWGKKMRCKRIFHAHDARWSMMMTRANLLHASISVWTAETTG